MIKRVEDFSAISTDALNKIAEIVTKNEKSVVVDVVDNREKAILTKKQLKIEGYQVKIEPIGDNYKIIATVAEKIALEDALNSGSFKKLAWGRYSFQRESAGAFGLFKYDFDEGSIWRVMTGEDGQEYLIKEVDDDDENEILRIKTASNKQSFLNDDNVKDVVSIIYDIDTQKAANIVADMLESQVKDEFFKLIEKSLDKHIKKVVASNHFIESPDYHRELTSMVRTAVNSKQVKNLKQLENLIIEYTNQVISVTGKIKSVFE